jgi:hypothetical protein
MADDVRVGISGVASWASATSVPTVSCRKWIVARQPRVPAGIV